MNKWIMIEVAYARIPEEVKYWAKISVNEAESVRILDDERQLIERDLRREDLYEVPMDVVVEHLHQLLQTWPDAKVTMLQEPTRSRSYDRSKKGYELSPEETAMIRDRLEEAKRMYAPIERTVQVRPSPVRLEPCKENEDG